MPKPCRVPSVKDIQSRPTYWFSTLERAIHASDFEAAAHAQAKLHHLGVFVRFHLEPRRATHPEVTSEAVR